MANKSLDRRLKDAGFTDPSDPMYQLAVEELGKIAKDDKAKLRQTREQAAEDKKVAAEVAGLPTANWDDLNAHHAKLLLVFAGYGFMARSMKDDRLLSFVRNRRAFIDLCQLLKRDLDLLKAELAQIYAMHAGRTGERSKGRAGDMEMIAILEVHEHYQMWLMKHDSVCERTSAQIRAMIHDAESDMLKADRDAAAAAEAETAAATQEPVEA